MKRGQERCFRTFLVYSAASNDDRTKSGSVDEFGVPRRRTPLCRVSLLHVIHEVEAQSARSTRVERCEDARLAIGRNLGDLAKASIAQHAHGEITAFANAAVLSGDGGLSSPVLEPLHSCIVIFCDLCPNGSEIQIFRVSGVCKR